MVSKNTHIGDDGVLVNNGGRATDVAAFAVGGVVVLLACVMTMGVNLRNRSLWEPEELRYAQIASEMIQNREWALLRFNGVLYPDKPPLYYWTICAVASLTGGVGPVAARLPVIIAGAAATLLMYYWIWRTVGLRPALLTAAFLLATPFYLRSATEARMDMLLTFFIALANVSFYLNYTKDGASKWLHRLFWAAMALGTLTKGPVGFILPLLLALAFLLVEKRPGYLRKMRIAEGICIFTALVGFWLVAACLKGGKEFASNLLIHQNVHRVTDPWLHRNPIWHFAIAFPLLLLPWTFLIPAAVVHPWTQECCDDRREALFALLWAATGFAFFTAVPTKRSIYMLPLVPAMGALFGIVTEDCVFRNPLARFWRARLAFYIVPILLCALAAAAWSIAAKIYPDAGDVAKLACVPLFCGCAVAIVFLFGGRFEVGVLCLFVAVVMECVVLSHVLLPWGDGFKSVEPMIAALRRTVGDEDFSVFRDERTGYALYWGKPIPVVRGSYDVHDLEGDENGGPPDYFREDRKALVKFLNSPRRVWVLLRSKHLRELNDEDIQYHPVWFHWVGDRHHALATNQPPTATQGRGGANMARAVVPCGGLMVEVSASPCGLVSASERGVVLRAFAPLVSIQAKPVAGAGSAGEGGRPKGGRLIVKVVNMSCHWSDTDGLPEGVSAVSSGDPRSVTLSVDVSAAREIRLGLRKLETIPVAVLGQLCGLSLQTPRLFDRLVESVKKHSPAFAIVVGDKVCFARPGEFRLLDERMARLGVPVYGTLSCWDRGNADAAMPEHERRFGTAPLEFECNGFRCLILDSSLGRVEEEQVSALALREGGPPMVVFTATSPIHPQASSLPAAGPNARFLQALKAGGAVRLYCGGFDTFCADDRVGFNVVITGGTISGRASRKDFGPHWILARFSRDGIQDVILPLSGGGGGAPVKVAAPLGLKS